MLGWVLVVVGFVAATVVWAGSALLFGVANDTGDDSDGNAAAAIPAVLLLALALVGTILLIRAVTNPEGRLRQAAVALALFLLPIALGAGIVIVDP